MCVSVKGPADASHDSDHVLKGERKVRLPELEHGFNDHSKGMGGRPLPIKLKSPVDG